MMQSRQSEPEWIKALRERGASDELIRAAILAQARRENPGLRAKVAEGLAGLRRIAER